MTTSDISDRLRPNRRGPRRGPWLAWLALALALVAACAPPRHAPAVRPGPDPSTVILVSFDGFRADYLTRARLPHLEALIARGVRAEYLTPSFPSKTFPNHYTLVTGLYPGRHGIVANTIHDEATGRTFALSDRREVQDPMWWGGEPIWVTAARAGLRSATLFWPGSEAPIRGRQPSDWRPYDGSMPGRARVAAVLEWLDRPEAERPRFVGLYFEETDDAGHDGPERPDLVDALLRSDAWLGELMAGLSLRGLADRVNVVVVSDHGMAATSLDRVIVLDDYVPLADVRVVDINPTLGLIPKPGREDAVYSALRDAHPHLRVFRRADTPAAWHYRDHPRIPPIVGVADEGWQVMTRAMYDTLRHRGDRADSGQHGYDPSAASMRALFVAAGPAFRPGVVVPPFENVSVYNVLARVLRITPAPNDGDPSVLPRVLTPAAIAAR